MANENEEVEETVDVEVEGDAVEDEDEIETVANPENEIDWLNGKPAVSW